jgi:predicted transposase/invertase (TIGR01784 family)
MQSEDLRNFQVLPTQDATFRLLFSQRTSPGVLASLINAVRSTRPPVSDLTIANPQSGSVHPNGKKVILDVKAIDVEGNAYNVEMQVRRQGYWGDRSMFYLAHMITGQVKVGQPYLPMPSAVKIDLLDFDLYESDQAVWSFAMRDEKSHDQVFSKTAEIWVVEMPKYEKKGWDHTVLSDWLKFFQHSQSEAVMETISTPEVKQANAALLHMSADEWTREMLFQEEMRERDLATERYVGAQEGREKGRQEGHEDTALNLIHGTSMDNATIAAMCGLDVERVARLRERQSR